jgi:23S rRNA pseudouridine1911/1915/1917 synthase
VYEDDYIIIINKESGMVVHPGHGNYSGTLINALLYHFDNLPNNSSNRPGLVHRIDKDTSGLPCNCKNRDINDALAKQFFKKSVDREYYALVWGDVKDDEGQINAPIGRNPKNRLQMIVYEDIDGGKDAITDYKVIERFGYVTLISCKLQTGRTHQIRVHMKHIGHTLFNDERYGGDKILKGNCIYKIQTVCRQLL